MGTLHFSYQEAPVACPLPRRILLGDDEVKLLGQEMPFCNITLSEDGALWLGKQGEEGTMTFSRKTPPRYHRLKSDAFFTLKCSASNSSECVLHSTVRMLAKEMLLPDSFYYTGGKIRCRLGEKRGMLRLLDTSGHELQRRIVTANSATLEASVLAPGNYILEYSVDDIRTTRTIVRIGNPLTLQVADGKLSVDNRGFMRGRKRFYLFGVENTPEDVSTFPFSPEFTYTHHPDSAGGCRKTVSVGSIPGGRIIRTPRATQVSRLMHEEKNQKAIYDDFFKKLIVRHDVFYRMEYESGRELFFGEDENNMEFCKDQPRWYEWVYANAKSHCPDIILSLHLDSRSQLTEYAKAADILEYADWTASFAEDDMMRHLPGAIWRLRHSLPEKPIVFWLGGSIPDGNRHSAEELRAGIYLSILAGFAGNVIHTGYTNIPKERTRVWSMLCGITREINAFYEDFINGCDVPFDLPEGFAARLKKLPDNSFLLVVVNLKDGENRMDTPAGIRYFTPYEPAVIRW